MAKKLANLKVINQNITWPSQYYEFAVTDLSVGICSAKVPKSAPNSILFKIFFFLFWILCYKSFRKCVVLSQRGDLDPEVDQSATKKKKFVI